MVGRNHPCNLPAAFTRREIFFRVPRTLKLSAPIELRKRIYALYTCVTCTGRVCVVCTGVSYLQSLPRVSVGSLTLGRRRVPSFR